MSEEHERVMETISGIDAAIEELIACGDIERVMVDGEPGYKLTAQGMAKTEAMLPADLVAKVNADPPNGKESGGTDG